MASLSPNSARSGPTALDDMTSPDAEQSLQARDQARHEQIGVDDLSRHQPVDGAHDRKQDERGADASAKRYQKMLKFTDH